MQRLHHPVAGGVHAETAPEVHAHRVGTVPVDDRAQPVAEVVEAVLPGRRLQLPVDPPHRPLDAVGVVVELGQRAALRAGVPVRQRVIVVAADPDDLVTLDVDHDTADRRADPAEAPHGPHP